MDSAAAATRIGAASAVLIPDTCALLDLIRIAERHANPVTELDAASRILTAARGNAPVTVATPDVVEREWTAHHQAEHDRQVERLAKLEVDVGRILDSADFLTGASSSRTPVMPTGVIRNLQTLASDLLAHSIRLTASEANQLAAYQRHASSVGPARKGKDCLTDCTIAELVLELARVLRPSSSQKIVFLTSNKSDFCDPANTRMPHRDLRADFEAQRIDLVQTWGWAASLLGL